MSEDFILHYGHCHSQKSCRLLENHEKPTKARETNKTYNVIWLWELYNVMWPLEPTMVMWLIKPAISCDYFLFIVLYIWTYIYFIQFVMDFINDYCNQLLNKIFWFLFASCLKLFSSAFDITLIYGYTGIFFRATYH